MELLAAVVALFLTFLVYLALTGQSRPSETRSPRRWWLEALLSVVLVRCVLWVFIAQPEATSLPFIIAKGIVIVILIVSLRLLHSRG